jgi:hypothetical protein
VDVQHRQRVSTPFTEFDIGYNEQISGEVEFDGDTVDFDFWAPFSIQPLKCYVRLSDAETNQSLLNGEGNLDIAGENDDHNYLSFSGFGYLDERMTQRVGKCRYEVWLDGEARAKVTVYV